MWLFIRNLPRYKLTSDYTKLKQILKEQLETIVFSSEFVENNDCVKQIIVMHGKQTALIELSTEDNCDKIINYCERNEIVVDSKVLKVIKGKEPLKKEWNHREDEEKIETEVKRVLDSIIRDIVTEDSNKRHEIRIEKKKNHAKTMQNYSKAMNQKGASLINICWDFSRTGGICFKGEGCKKEHRSDIPISSWPTEMRFLIDEDHFPSTRESSIEKEIVNSYLVPICVDVVNKNCLVLDGASCNSVSALLKCEKQTRTKENMFVANICTATFEEIKCKDICIPFHGSVRAFLESQCNILQFGVIYLDYCSRITAGRLAHIEKSPISDLQYLFENSFCDPSGCVLAICICKESVDSTLADSPQLLRHLVSTFASLQGLYCVNHYKRFEDFAGTYTEIFHISDREHINLKSVVNIDKFIKSISRRSDKFR